MDPIPPSPPVPPSSVAVQEPPKPQVLGKDAFLRLLVEQLKNQDPTNPVQDKEFLAQMAQFNSLEQMMQMNDNIGNLQQSLSSNQALSLLGKKVSVEVGRDPQGQALYVHGQVAAILPGNPVRVSVNGSPYPLNAIKRVGAE